MGLQDWSVSTTPSELASRERPKRDAKGWNPSEWLENGLNPLHLSSSHSPRPLDQGLSRCVSGSSAKTQQAVARELAPTPRVISSKPTLSSR